MKMKNSSMAFFKTGAWILVVAGWAHAAIALPDAWMQGAFSPASGDLITAMKSGHLNIVDFLKGNGTSIIGGTVWGASIGFAIAVGVLIGFLGVLLLVAVDFNDAAGARNRRLLYTAIAASAVMTAIAAFFYFWFPLTILAASLVCFVLALTSSLKGASYVVR
jgi:hypothetical protein